MARGCRGTWRQLAALGAAISAPRQNRTRSWLGAHYSIQGNPIPCDEQVKKKRVSHKDRRSLLAGMPSRLKAFLPFLEPTGSDRGTQQLPHRPQGKPDPWAGREDALRSAHRDPHAEVTCSMCAARFRGSFWSTMSVPLVPLLSFVSAWSSPAISLLPPIVVREVESSATQPGRPSPIVSCQAS
jgi:hypothetical protein